MSNSVANYDVQQAKVGAMGLAIYLYLLFLKMVGPFTFSLINGFNKDLLSLNDIPTLVSPFAYN